ncbi:U4/U6 small nuclear ribonucleoprotein prp4 [Exophiala xenobiotica]|nr:U4/U6 small nuclear ribonucleoprotein prp4 [Exophiala xenobiotica]KAK5440348.1 U4/U6 small nuclear ribonucleoprotein prp4 [Exophiala xenobiotica]KAK5552199.1 U4/U6 small nuclear ribonucleoprotein prp4 [Exophiala xenobiotica]
MASRSPSQSDGEVFSSDSEAKAKSIPSFHNNSKVDRHTRPYSTSHSTAPGAHRSRSRSPYRAPRAEKRPRDYDHSRNRPDNNPRTFGVRYEDDRRHRGHGSYEQRGAKRSKTYSRSRSRSRSPYRHSRVDDAERANTKTVTDNSGKSEAGLRHASRQAEKSAASTSRQSGHSSNVAATATQASTGEPDTSRDTSDRPDTVPKEDVTNEVPKIVDEAALIEERRRRREAIKNKYRGQAPPLLVQALHLGADSRTGSPAVESYPTTPGRSESPPSSSPRTPKEVSLPQSPADFNFEADAEMSNPFRDTPPTDGPSAADYDPTVDMEEERARHDKRLFKEDDISLNHAEEQVVEHIKESSVSDPKKADEFDMFADEDDDDMFAEAPMTARAATKTAQALDVTLMDDWDDAEGYYITILGELMQDRYHVTQNLGRGMFSSVVRATDSHTGKDVAVKIVRNNETMQKAGIKEIEILKDIAANDPEDKKHVIRLQRSFNHKGHLCMVFENLSMNLREVLKKFGRDVGINIKAIRAYAQQLFLGLSLLKKCQYIHADLKPDNILVNEARSTLKICDLGSASPITENATAPYLVSRFYRAPEVILGIPYDYGIDMWSIGCTLYELYTGKILFTGRNNNGMLRAIMECRGKFPHKLLRRGTLAYDYFDDLLNFRAQEVDKVTGRTVVRMIDIKPKPVKDLRSRLLPKDKRLDEQERKELELFIDLLDKCLDLRPEKRITPNDALKHSFILRTKA